MSKTQGERLRRINELLHSVFQEMEEAHVLISEARGEGSAFLLFELWEERANFEQMAEDAQTEVEKWERGNDEEEEVSALTHLWRAEVHGAGNAVENAIDTFIDILIDRVPGDCERLMLRCYDVRHGLASIVADAEEAVERHARQHEEIEGDEDEGVQT